MTRASHGSAESFPSSTSPFSGPIHCWHGAEADVTNQIQMDLSVPVLQSLSLSAVSFKAQFYSHAQRSRGAFLSESVKRLPGQNRLLILQYNTATADHKYETFSNTQHRSKDAYCRPGDMEGKIRLLFGCFYLS